MGDGIRLFTALALLVFCILLFASTTLAFDRNVRIYEYEATVGVGVDEPTKYVSKFHMEGLIKMQQISSDKEEKNTYAILLADLKYENFYGQEMFKKRNLQFATKLNALQNPYLAVYKRDGKLDYIKTHTNETDEIKNIKKSIALGLQSDWKTTLDIVFKNTKGKVTLQEQTIHGNCEVEYLARNLTRNLVKSYDPKKCNKFIHNIRGYSAYYKDYTDNIKSQMSANIHCTYGFDLEFDKPHFKYYICSEDYIWDMNTEMLYSDVMVPQSTAPTFMQMGQVIRYQNLSSLDLLIPHDQLNIFSSYDDLKNKNEMINVDNVKDREIIMQLFDAVNVYMKENRLTRHSDVVVNQQLFNRIQSVLDELNLEDLEKLYNEFGYINSPDMEDLRSIFIQMIPYIGTRSGLLFIRDIVMNKKIPEVLAVRILKTLPSFIREPTKELLFDLEQLISINNGLSPCVKKTGILSYAYLISRVYKDSNEADDLMMEKYLKHFSNAFEFAEATEMKLVYLHALGNTRSHEAIKYLAPIVLRRNSSTEDWLVTNRLRLIAIHALSNIINADDESTIQSLKYILLDNKELRSLRLAAYDVLFNVLKLDSDQLNQLDLALSLVDDEHIQNYHRSNIQNLETLDALPKEMSNIADRLRRANVSPAMARSSVIQLNDRLKMIIQSFLKILMISSRLGSNSKIRLSNVLENGFAAAIKHEIIENTRNKVDVSLGLYWYTNAEMTMLDKSKLQGKDVSFDVWIKSTNWINDVHTFNLSKDIQKRSSKLLAVLTDYIESISNKPFFEYQTFTSFSVSSISGINAVFEHKMPCLRKLKVNDNIQEHNEMVNVTSIITFTSWEDGYIGASIYNPINELMHSVRRTKLYDTFIPSKVSVIYNASNNTWNIIYAIIIDEDQKSLNNDRGGSLYTAVNVMIDKKKSLQINENACDTCGYELAKSSLVSQKINDNVQHESYDFFGLRFTSTMYDCDIYSRLFHELFIARQLMDKRINNCGILVKIGPDLKRTIKQIEAKISSNLELLQSPDEPWYSLPGFKLDFKLSLVARKTLDNSASNLGTFNIDAGTSQGHISSNLKMKFSKKHDERKNLVFCCEMQRNYPNISDTHLPSEVTPLYTNTDIRATFGFSTDDFCSDSILSIDSNLIGKMSENHLDALSKRARNSRCAHQKATPLFAHPPGSFPLTWDCIHESIINTTLRHYTLNFNHKGIPMMFLLVTNSMLEKIKNDWPEINIKLVSPISRALVDTMTYEIDYPITQRSLHNFTFVETLTDNIFYSKSFTHKFMNDSIKVTNVFPKIILFDKNKVISNANMTNWKRIYADKIASRYSINVKLIDDEKLSVKLDFMGHELILEPTEESNVDNEGLLNDMPFKPSIYFDKKYVDFDERMFLPSSDGVLDTEYIFRLLKVDDYIMIIPKDTLISVYYTVNSVTILRED